MTVRFTVVDDTPIALPRQTSQRAVRVRRKQVIPELEVLGSGICEARDYRVVVRDERSATTSKTCIERSVSCDHTRE